MALLDMPVRPPQNHNAEEEPIVALPDMPVRPRRSHNAEEVPLEALTLDQPLASLLVHGLRRITGREWNSSYQGPLWIHASIHRPNPKEIRRQELFCREVHKLDGGTSNLVLPLRYPTACLIGLVNVLGVLPVADVTGWSAALPAGAQLEVQDCCAPLVAAGNRRRAASDSAYLFICEDAYRICLPLRMGGQQGHFWEILNQYHQTLKQLHSSRLPAQRMPIDFGGYLEIALASHKAAMQPQPTPRAEPLGAEPRCQAGPGAAACSLPEQRAEGAAPTGAAQLELPVTQLVKAGKAPLPDKAAHPSLCLHAEKSPLPYKPAHPSPFPQAPSVRPAPWLLRDTFSSRTSVMQYAFAGEHRAAPLRDPHRDDTRITWVNRGEEFELNSDEAATIEGHLNSAASKGEREYKDKVKAVTLNRQGMDPAQVAEALGRDMDWARKWCAAEMGSLRRPKSLQGWLPDEAMRDADLRRAYIPHAEAMRLLPTLLATQTWRQATASSRDPVTGEQKMARDEDGRPIRASTKQVARYSGGVKELDDALARIFVDFRILGWCVRSAHSRPAVYSVQRAGCRMQNEECRMQCAVCSMQCVECSMQYAVCNLQYAACSLPYAACCVQYSVLSVGYAVCKCAANCARYFSI